MMLELNRVYNIDCMEGLKNLPEGHKYCIVTDPPFNVGYHYNQYKDKKPEEEYYCWLSDIVGDLPCCIIHYPEQLYKFAFQIGEVPNRLVSWVYNSNTPRQHRDAAYFRVKPDFNLVRQPYKNPKDKRIAARIAAGHIGGKCYDWMEVNQVKNVSKNSQEIYHPCQMPVEVMRRLVGIVPKDYVIVDPFMGSGTTAIACILNDRDFIGFEMDADYCKLAEDRIKTELENKIQG